MIAPINMSCRFIALSESQSICDEANEWVFALDSDLEKSVEESRRRRLSITDM